jgi:hypothetical protein
MWKSTATVTSSTGWTLEQIAVAVQLFEKELNNGNIAEPPLPDEQIGSFDESGSQFIRYYQTEADANYWINLFETTVTDHPTYTWVLEEVSE